MASVKIVEASIVCAANMDVTVLCRRLQIFIYILVPLSSWSKIHDWSNLFPVIMIFFSHLVCSGISLPQEILPRFDQFDNCISARSDCTILTAMSVFGSGFLNSSHVLLFPFSEENCVVKKKMLAIDVGDHHRGWWHCDFGESRIKRYSCPWCSLHTHLLLNHHYIYMYM